MREFFLPPELGAAVHPTLCCSDKSVPLLQGDREGPEMSEGLLYRGSMAAESADTVVEVTA